MTREIKKVVDQIATKYDPEKIILFGSHASGDSTARSDIDLAVIKETKERFIDRIKKIARIVKTWEALDVLVYTPKEWAEALRSNHYFIREIDATGTVVYER